ncbi:MAG: MBL fold metallo-hydrolase [Dehalococcoidia bacterium]|nr:MBL fold metallo-hydrolase [Dehalococcoidia bacterium]
MTYIQMPRPIAGGAPASTLRWLGHSSFLLTTAKGTKILMDPIPKGYGYDGPPLEGVDAITITHEHGDHVNVSLAEGNPLVLRGLAGGDWVRIDQQVKEVLIHSVGTYHDGSQGNPRGKNAVFVFEVEGTKIVHLGDLGHVLSKEQTSSIGPVDIALVPVGGFYTIDASQATQVVEQLGSKVVIPMHFQTGKLRPDWPGGGVDDFLAGKRVERLGSSTYAFTRETLPNETTVVVLISE